MKYIMTGSDETPTIQGASSLSTIPLAPPVCYSFLSSCCPSFYFFHDSVPTYLFTLRNNRFPDYRRISSPPCFPPPPKCRRASLPSASCSLDIVTRNQGGHYSTNIPEMLKCLIITNLKNQIIPRITLIGYMSCSYRH